MIKKKIVSAVLIGALTVSTVLSGCNTNSENTESTAPAEGSAASVSADGSLAIPEDGGFKNTYEPSSDKYRTYYEIFPYSFYDSDGDGVGDLNGITKKLDYLNDGDPSTTDDLGIEGIWLMPIMQSPSYHKYNISDYETVDKLYGTNDDFKTLTDEAHKRNINVIIDLVINHTSRTHEWYKKAVQELKQGKTDGYAQYYHFEQNKTDDGWRAVGFDNWYYEGQFDSDMPDLNLKNENVRKEIEDIVKYWIDLGVDGFRLDAVLWYESTGNEDSIEDLKWLYDYAKTVKEDVYMVGECWTNSPTIAEYYKSGLDSFFDFSKQGGTGNVKMAVSRQNAKNYVESLASWQETITANNPNAINAPFISNHDTGRSAGFFMTNTARKLGAALYILSPGNPFIYYGEEIAMTSTADNDPDKRQGMYWSKTDTTGYVSSIPGANYDELPEQTVEEALKDEDSLLNFYKRAVRLNSQNPEIARGTLKAVSFDDNKKTAGYVSTYNDSSVMVIYNLSEETATVEVPSDTFKINEVRGYLLADSGDGLKEQTNESDIDDLLLGDGSKDESSKEDTAEGADVISVKEQSVTLPAFSVIVLK